ncbi:hypothetical protein IF1G_03748 [Cordyceps javanica]|uniref:Uncharacterized protein n=1 Tax=Cordyceps javanica TaxID=43265 RepID=A0A545V8H4_9HYPO|nr:hypothetical protein IF1G_03748 [Cordyceps javanica]
MLWWREWLVRIRGNAVTVGRECAQIESIDKGSMTCIVLGTDTASIDGNGNVKAGLGNGRGAIQAEKIECRVFCVTPALTAYPWLMKDGAAGKARKLPKYSVLSPTSNLLLETLEWAVGTRPACY